MKLRDILYYSALTSLILISFFLYSSRYYPLLNSDDALNVLMTFYYKLPQDFYCWGQDRGGTLIPLISQIPHRVFGLSPINAISLSNYLILILGFIGFSSLFKNKFTKLIFAIVWFFPPIIFIDLTRFPLGVEYSLIGFSIYLINKVDLKNKEAVINHLLIITTILILSISIWVSDLTIVSITVLGLTLLIYQYLKNKKLNLNKAVLLYITIGVIGNLLFIRYAKSFASVVTDGYVAFNDIATFFNALKIILTEIYQVLAFQNMEPLLSLYSWFVLFFIAFCSIAIYKRKPKVSLNSNKWIAFFIIDFLAVFGVILISNWVYLNGMGRWYFVPSYISLSMVTLLIFDGLKFEYYKGLRLKSFILIIVLVGAFSTIYSLKYVYPKTLRSQVDVRSELLELGEIGIIGEFWNSYISTCPDPTRIKATPHEYSGAVRNQKLVDEVFAQPKLYVIKDMWMKSFPDTLKQFGYVLVKKDSAFNLGDSEIAQYIKVKRNEPITFGDLILKQGVDLSDRTIRLNKKSTSLINEYAVCGPYLQIGVGNFKIKYKLSVENAVEGQAIAMFDVAADYGKTVFTQKEFMIKKQDSINYFELSFSTDKRYSNLEFRTYYYGNGNLTIEEMQLVEE